MINKSSKNQLPSKNETKTWLNQVITNKCFSKGNFKFNYNSSNIDTAWQLCLEMPTNIKSLLYSMHASTKINQIFKNQKSFVIIFYCDSRIAENVITKVSEYLDYSSPDGLCTLITINSSKGSKQIKKIGIKKLDIYADCFADENVDDQDIKNT